MPKTYFRGGEREREREREREKTDIQRDREREREWKGGGSFQKRSWKFAFLTRLIPFKKEMAEIYDIIYKILPRSSGTPAFSWFLCYNILYKVLGCPIQT